MPEMSDNTNSEFNTTQPVVGEPAAAPHSCGRVFAFSLDCPHKGRMLEWVDAENRLYCSKHKAHFGADGRLTAHSVTAVA